MEAGNSMNNRQVAMQRLKRICLVVLACLVLLVAGCTTGALSVTARVTLYAQQNWSARVEVVYAQLEHQYAGAQIEQMLSMAVSQMRAQGIRANYQKHTQRNGNVQYIITASGQGYQLLNSNLLDGQAVIQVDESYNPPQIIFSYAPFGSFFGAALSRTFSLSGGKILASNGIQTSRNTVTWSNPVSTMQATLTPASRLSLGPQLLGLAGVSALVLVVLVVRRAGKRRCPACGARLPRQAEFCTNCGASLGL